MVCSREVAAFSSPPSPSKISAISCALYVREPLKSRCSMKWETPALPSVSSREPAPIQKPSATERTPGTRSEITRSPESSSERTYFCIHPLLRVGRQELVDEVVDLLERQLCGGVGIEHRGVVDVLEIPGQGGLDGESLNIDVRLDQGGELRRQGAEGLGPDPARVRNAGHLDA